MHKGEVFVRAKQRDGRWGNVDVLDLDDESFRAFVVDQLRGLRAVVGLRHPEGEAVELRQRPREPVKVRRRRAVRKKRTRQKEAT